MTPMEVFTLSIKKPDVRIHVAVNVLWIKEAQVEKLWSLCSVQHRGDSPVCCDPDVSHSIILSRSLCHIQTSKVALWDEQVHNQTFGICGHCSTSCGARSRCAKACALLIFSLLTRLTTLKNLVPGLVPEMTELKNNTWHLHRHIRLPDYSVSCSLTRSWNLIHFNCCITFPQGKYEFTQPKTLRVKLVIYGVNERGKLLWNMNSCNSGIFFYVIMSLSWW